jgi:predicted Zn-dependent protease
MARRVNSRFLIILSIVVLGGVAAAFALKGPIMNMVKGDRSKKLIEQGDALVKEAEAPEVSPTLKREKYEAAVRNYAMASGADPKNTALYIKYGDTLNKMTPFDVKLYLPAARSMWEKALEFDPAYMPALRRLQDSYFNEAEFNPQAIYFTKIRDRAETIHKLDPKDLRAHALMYIAPLHRWLANIETPLSEIQPAIGELITLIDENPTAPELAVMVRFAALAKAKLGGEQKRNGDERAAAGLLEESRQIFTKAIDRNNQSGELYYRYYEQLANLRKIDPEHDVTLKYLEDMRKAVASAQKLVKPDDELFVKVAIAAFGLAKTNNDADQILTDLRNARPYDQRVRLFSAQMLHARSGADKKKLDEAIALLELPMVDAGWTGVDALQKEGLETKSLIELANCYIDRYASLPQDERPEAMKVIEATYEKAHAKAYERSDILKIRGRMELLRGGQDATVKAIQTFEKAQRQYQSENNGTEDVDLMYYLARAYLATRQTGEAKTQLLKIKELRPSFIPVRLLLAQVLISEGEVKAAREHVDFLEKQAPEDPEVLRLVLATLDPAKDAMRVKSCYEKLPEETRAEKMTKAMIANLSPVSNPDDGLRLYRQLIGTNPADFEALQGAKDILVARGKTDEAVALFKSAQAVKPDDARVALVLRQLEGASATDLQKMSVDLLRKQYANDPFSLELKLYEYYAVAGDRAESVKHLLAAEKVKPDEGRLQDLMFQHYLGEQNWDKAAEYVEKLAPKNWDQANGLIYRFRLAMARGDVTSHDEVTGALDYARQLTSKLEQFARSWIFLGQAQQAAGQYTDAISSYGVALDKQSESPEAIAGIIACYTQLNRPTEALRYIERGMASHPNNGFFKEQWKQYQMRWGDPSTVIKPALAERDANPNDPNRWLAVGMAQYAAAKKRDAKWAQYAADAKATFAEAIKRWPGEKLLWALQSELADFTQDTAGGEALLREMIARPEFKGSPEPTMMLADHFLKQNQPDKAETVMRQALDTFPGNVDVRRRLAAYYTQAAAKLTGDARTQKFNEALKLLDAGSSDKLVRQQIVEIYMLAGRFEEADKLLHGLLASNDKDAQLHALLGVVLLNEKREDQAQEELTTALVQDPKNQTALYTRGQLRLKATVPQVDGAIKDLVALRDLNPNHIEARVSLADAFRQQQRLEEAAHELDEALRRAPARRDVRINLVGLYAAMKPPQWAEAERLVADAERSEPRESIWKRMQSKMFSARAMHDRAVLKIREALEVDHTNGELLRDYLDILEAGRMWGQLLAETDRVFSLDKNMAANGWWVYVKRAAALSNLDRKQEAMADFVKAMDIVQADKTANQDALIAIIDKIRLTLDSQRAIDRAIILANGKDAQATRWKVVLAYLYLQAGDNAKAIEKIEDVQRAKGTLDEQNLVMFLNVAGNVYMSNAVYDKARACYEELLAKRGEDLGALNNLACIFAEHVQPPNLPKALEYSQRALTAMNQHGNPDANVLDTVGWMNVLAGGAKIDAGIDYLNNSIKVNEIAEAQYHLGEAYLKKNLPDPAKRSLTRASEMIQERIDKKQGFDENLKKKVEEALARAEKALVDLRAAAP